MPSAYLILPRKPCLVYSSTGLKYLISVGLKNMYLIVAFFLCTRSGYPVNTIRLRMIFIGLGGIAVPVATTIEQFPDFNDYSVKQITLQGAKTIGPYMVAIAVASVSL